MNEQTGPEGEQLYVDRNETERGSEGPFYVVYLDSDRTRRWGFACGHCDSFLTAMDSMGRIKCSECGNLRKPDEWDAAHE